MNRPIPSSDDINRLCRESAAEQAEQRARVGEARRVVLRPDGDSLELLQQVYRNDTLPLQLRVDAARAALKFERPTVTDQAPGHGLADRMAAAQRRANATNGPPKLLTFQRGPEGD